MSRAAQMFWAFYLIAAVFIGFPLFATPETYFKKRGWSDDTLCPKCAKQGKED